MLLSRVLLAGPLEVALASPTDTDSVTDEETFKVSGGVVTVCFSFDTLHTGEAGIAVSLCNPHEGTGILPDDALVGWVLLQGAADTARLGEPFLFSLCEGENPEYRLTFRLSETELTALRVLSDTAPFDAAAIERHTAALQRLLKAS
jgi:hypothetical protein